MSIRKKLTILFLLVGLVPTFLVSVFAYVTVSNELTFKTTEQISGIAAKQLQRLNTLLQNKREEAIRLTSAQYGLLNSLGVFLESRKPQDIAPALSILRESKIEVPQIESIYLSDLEGKVLTTTVTTGALKQLSKDAIFINTNETTTVRVREDTDGINKLFVTAHLNLNKKEVGRLLIVYKLDDFLATVQDHTGLGITGETIVATKNDKGQSVTLFPLRFDTEAALKVTLSGLPLFEDAQGEEAEGTDYRGRKVIVAAGTIDSGRWGVATIIDKDEALAPIIGLRNTVTVIFVVSALAIIAIALYFTRYFTRPIIRLTEKTRQMMNGDLRQQILVNSSDEIGRLTSTFNQMANNLAGSYAALEQKVADRTKALDQKVEELESAKSKDEAILESIADGLVVTDSDGAILLINALAVELLEMGSDAVGKNIAGLTLFDDTGSTLAEQDHPLRAAISTGHKIIQNVKIGSKDNKRSLSVTASPVMQQGRAIGVIQIIRDITKEKEIDRMKTEFISIASHQLRTPLSAIKWFSEMLLSGDAGKLSKEQTEFTNNISQSTERMIELVASLLNISRIESGRIIVDPEPTDLKELVTGIINDLKAKTEERQQILAVSVHKDLPLINLDPHLIGQVYLNLLTNAIKYTPKEGEISVFISRKGDQVISQVSDNGYGIPKAEQSKMFGKFFRATNIVKVESDGTGLGMYLVKAIIESSGGKIWFESEEGKGTTFWFSLPLSGMKAKEGEVTLGD